MIKVRRFSGLAIKISCGQFVDRKIASTIDSSNKVWEKSFPTAEKEVVPEKKKPLTKDERLALIKERAEKKSANDID